MECSAVRECLSAQLDGESLALDADLSASHCASCPDCTEWHARAAALHRQMRLAPAPKVPNLTPEIMQALSRVPLPATTAQRMLKTSRVLLALCAVLQLVATVPMLLGTIHLDHELGSWDLALSAGLLIAAWSPRRAWGMLPLVGAVALALGTTAIIDVASGATTLGSESGHLMEGLGLLFLWNIARLSRDEQLITKKLQVA